MSSFLGVLLRSLEYGSFYALSALSIILVYKTSYTTNFAQATLGMFNTFLVATLVVRQGWSLYAAIPIGIVSAILIGIVIDILIIRRASSAGPVGKQIITLGLISVFLGLTPILFGVNNLSLPRLISNGNLSIVGVQFSYNALFNILFGIFIMGLMFFTIQKTKIGLAIRTTASNETTAQIMGVPTKTITMAAWGAAYGISVLLNVIQVYMPGGTVWGKPILYAVLLLIMYVKPYGIFGKQRVKKV